MVAYNRLYERTRQLEKENADRRAMMRVLQRGTGVY